MGWCFHSSSDWIDQAVKHGLLTDRAHLRESRDSRVEGSEPVDHSAMLRVTQVDDEDEPRDGADYDNGSHRTGDQSGGLHPQVHGSHQLPVG